MTNESRDKQPATTDKKQVVRWRCPNCGQTIFTAPDYEPPDICHYCRDMTTWQRVKDDEKSNNKSTS